MTCCPRRRPGAAVPGGRPPLPAPRPRGRADARAGRRRARRGADVEVDATGCAVLPGLVDCHTHLPFAGWRAEEYERKVTGVPYEEIARLGGGIAASARALAAASDDDVLAQAEGLAAELLQHGTTAFEGKTGYGLSRDGEARAARLGRELAARVVQPMRLTGLFAHAVPPGFTADALDGRGGGARARVRRRRARHLRRVGRVRDRAARRAWARSRRDLGLPLRAHVEQLSDHALGAGRAASRRALGRPPLGHPPRRHRAARGRPRPPPCCCPAPS